MSEALDRARAAAKRLKVFPLPSVVLLPGSALPLHIFEQRYRDLISDALATDGVFAMAQVMPGQEALLDGAPALEEIVCIGVITLHEQLDNGRYNVMLVGVVRARIVKELARTKTYRELEVDVLADAPFGGPEELKLRDSVVELVARVPQEVGQRIAQVATRAKGGMLADVVASTIMDEPTQRYQVLMELDVGARMRIVLDELSNILGSLRAPSAVSKKPELLN